MLLIYRHLSLLISVVFTEIQVYLRSYLQGGVQKIGDSYTSQVR